MELIIFRFKCFNSPSRKSFDFK